MKNIYQKIFKIKLMIPVILSLGLCQFSYADVFEDYNIARPEIGDKVCEAYLRSHRWSSENIGQGIIYIRNLPVPYCDNNDIVENSASWRGLSLNLNRLRVVATGDHYTYNGDSQEQSLPQVTNSDLSERACRARVVDENYRLHTLYHLPESLCRAGMKLAINIDGLAQIVEVEVTFDPHYVSHGQTDFAYEIEESIGSDASDAEEPDLIINSSVSVEI